MQLLFRLSRSRRFRRRRVRSGHHFFLHRRNVRHGLVLVRNELDLVRVRQLRNTQHLAKRQVADVGIDVVRNIRRQALDLDFAQHLFHDAALLLHTGRFAHQVDRHAHLEHLVERDALQVDVQQIALDGLILPVDDHRLGRLPASQSEIKNRVVAGLGVQDARHMPRIHADRERFLARSIHHGRNLSATAHGARVVLRPRFARLRFEYVLFQCSCHKFQFLSDKDCHPEATAFRRRRI